MPDQDPPSTPPIPRRGLARRFGFQVDEVDDRTVAGLLAYHALIEIRSAARKSRRQPDTPAEEILEQVSFLADLAHNLPLIARPQGRRRPDHPGVTSRRDRAMDARPMSWTWNTTGAQGREWMSRHIADAGYRRTPPPALPTPRKDFARWSLRQRLRLLAGWPVRTPPGRQPLPKQARMLKALDRDHMYALYEEAGRERLGLGGSSPRFYVHLHPGATHYLFPDPADCYWPSDIRPWWQCRVSRIRQRRLALAARMLERDYHLWYRDHEEACSPQRCGYAADPTEQGSTKA